MKLSTGLLIIVLSLSILSSIISYQVGYHNGDKSGKQIALDTVLSIVEVAANSKCNKVTRIVFCVKTDTVSYFLSPKTIRLR